MKNMLPNNNKYNSLKQVGFTLIELSIVLVIIGLIVGGVLAGRDLIKASEIRNAISQYEKFNTATFTFRNKYNGLPADLPITQASGFGLFTGSLSGGVGEGDGNGFIESGESAGIKESFQRKEPLVFWRHLSEANLIDGNYGANIGAFGFINAAGVDADLYFPPAKIGANHWFAGSRNGFNYYMLSGIDTLTVGGAMPTRGELSPFNSYNIDSKIDDGMPNTGKVQARRGGYNMDTGFDDLSTSNAAYSSVAGTNPPNCLAGSNTREDLTNTYATNTTVGNSLNCALRLRFN